jgi:competence protein ComEC
LNALLWLPVELAMVSGFVLLLVGWFPPAAGICGGVCGGSLTVMQWLVDAARQLPHSCVWVPGPADWWLAGFYAAFAVALLVPRYCPPRRWCVALLGGWTAVGFVVGGYDRRRDDVDCRVLSVQHGCAVIVQLPSGQTLLYDAGQLGSHAAACRSISAALWSDGITHLDAVVLSHADVDHYNALPELLERFSVGAIYMSPAMLRARGAAMAALVNAIENRHVPIRIVRAGDRFDGGRGCSIRVLHPPAGIIFNKDNSNSVVLSIEHAGHRFLLPGDLEYQGMELLLTADPVPHEVVLSPHHGSKRSRPQLLVEWAKARWAIVSGGRVRQSEELEATYAPFGCGVWHTNVSGAVRVRLGPKGVRVSGFRSPSQSGYYGWAGLWSGEETTP